MAGIWQIRKQDTTLDNPLGSYILHYMFVDENGNKLSKEYTAAAPISDCEPILKDGKVVYYASNANTVNFYSIDAQTGNFETVKSYHVAGENVSWEISDNTLTFSGKGTVSINNGEIHRSSVAGLVNGQAYTDTYGWKQIKIILQRWYLNLESQRYLQMLLKTMMFLRKLSLKMV